MDLKNGKITWEEKKEMVRLGNEAKQTDNVDDRIIFYNYALEHFEDFDYQALDMFANSVEVVPNKMKEDKQYWEKLYPLLFKSLNNDNTPFEDCGMSLSSLGRLTLLEILCEDELGLKI